MELHAELARLQTAQASLEGRLREVHLEKALAYTELREALRLCQEEKQELFEAKNQITKLEKDLEILARVDGSEELVQEAENRTVEALREVEALKTLLADVAAGPLSPLRVDDTLLEEREEMSGRLEECLAFTQLAVEAEEKSNEVIVKLEDELATCKCKLSDSECRILEVELISEELRKQLIENGIVPKMVHISNDMDMA